MLHQASYNNFNQGCQVLKIDTPHGILKLIFIFAVGLMAIKVATFPKNGMAYAEFQDQPVISVQIFFR